MRTFLRRLVIALVAVSALAWPPSRRLVADLLITVGAHLDHLDDPPGPTPEQQQRMRARLMDELARAVARRGQRDERQAQRHDTNGAHPI